MAGKSGSESRRLRSGGPIRVGLTGSLASGKSTTLKYFKKHGWSTASADEMVAKIYRKKGIRKEDLIARFGRSPAGLKRLEKWIHPLVREKTLKFIKKSKGPVIVEVPLLFESKFDRYFDFSIFIFAPLKDRIKRVTKRGMDLQLFKFLDHQQLPPREKIRRADFIIRNRSKKDLKKEVKHLSRILLSK
ncbi:MAG: Dephospho-CoA kinase [Bacteriovoracaceae bacterium]|nr:Dephospho-CoA kinase [Bacteriovoracaceae bacterium]